MNFIKLFTILMFVGIIGDTDVFAQKKGQKMNQQKEEVFDYGIPISDFPQPPGVENATAVVNFKLDQMHLNPGRTELHYDSASSIKLYAYYNPWKGKYALIAVDDFGKEYPVEVEISEDSPTCIFAYIGPDWVNVICSEKYEYEEDLEKLQKKD